MNVVDGFSASMALADDNYKGVMNTLYDALVADHERRLTGEPVDGVALLHAIERAATQFHEARLRMYTEDEAKLLSAV